MAKLKASKRIWGNRFVTISYRLLFRTVLISDQTSHNDQHFSHIKHTSHQVLIACVGFFWAPVIRFFIIQQICVPEHEQKLPHSDVGGKNKPKLRSEPKYLKEKLYNRIPILCVLTHDRHTTKCKMRVRWVFNVLTSHLLELSDAFFPLWLNYSTPDMFT